MIIFPNMLFKGLFVLIPSGKPINHSISLLKTSIWIANINDFSCNFFNYLINIHRFHIYERTPKYVGYCNKGKKDSKFPKRGPKQ